MNPGAILVGIAILVIAVPYVMHPLVNERKKQPDKSTPLKKDGEGGQRDALAAIRDLDFDFQTGKVTREDYETLRAQLVLEAAKYLQVKQQEDEKIETMIRARLQTVKPLVKCEKCGGEIRLQDRFCPTCGDAAQPQTESSLPAAQLTCPGCGKTIKERDLFCTGCGRRVNKQPKTESDIAKN